MYPYRFTYLEKTEMGDDKVDESFESTYFPPNDVGYNLENCQGTHPIDLSRDAPPSFPLLALDLQYGKEEYTVMKNVNQLPSAIEDIYSSGMN